MNKHHIFEVRTIDGLTIFKDNSSIITRHVYIHNKFYRHYHDLELAVFELGRLFCNGTNDLDYVIERLQVHKLDPQII